MRTTIHYILLVAMRDKMLAVLIAGLLVVVGISHVLASTMPVEQQHTALIFNASAARILLIIGSIVFVSFHVRQAFDAKEIDVILSRPLSREKLICAYWVGFAGISCLLTVACATTSLILLPINLYGFLLWIISLLLELWIMVAVSLCVSLILSSAVTSVITSLSMYILFRMMGFFLATIHSRYSMDIAWLGKTFRYALDAISLFTPRFDFFGQSSWILYGPTTNFSSDLLPILTQALIFIPILLLVSAIDMRKKQF